MGQRIDRPSDHTSSSPPNRSSSTRTSNSNLNLASSSSSSTATNESLSQMYQRGFNNEAFLRFLQSRQNRQNNRSRSNNNQNYLRFLNMSSTTQNGLNIEPLDSDVSSDDDEHLANHLFPSIFLGRRDAKCLVCKKTIPADDVETHIIMCLTKPKINYNEDVLTEEKGECVICLENLEKDQTIARLPCLCIYHKHCIDSWLKVNQSCPAHPPD